MNAFVPYLAALHQHDLLEQAAQHRRATLSAASQSTVPAWRRLFGSLARTLSGLLASVARSLDPSVQVDQASPLSAGRRADPLPAN